MTGKRTKEVGGDKERGEQSTIHGDRRSTITKNEVLDVAELQKHTLGKGREAVIREGDDHCTVANGHKTINVAKKYTQASQDQFAIAQGANGQTRLVMEDAVLVETPGDLKLKNDKVQVQLASGGKLKLEALEEIKLVCGIASIVLKKDGTIEVVGMKTSIGTSTSTLKCDPAGATLSGPKVTTMAQMLAEIQGTLIKIGS